ncbi:hypothetical protein HYW75_03695 [Candidatus Pacearchaeota archaeon]|nr:hypothetical protein [Candidatus Pacearchaeota archaeon]
MVKKSFFRKRTPEEILELKISRVYSQRGLVDRIWDLDPNSDAIELRTTPIPLRLLLGTYSAAEASRKDYKHGLTIHVDQPQSQKEALEYPYTPLAARMKAIDESLRDRKEEEINFIGITWQPILGTDRRWRVVPFDVPIEGVKIYDYALHRANGIEVLNKYTDAGAVMREGGQILCKVPSRTKRRERYKINLFHVPIHKETKINAIIWSLRSQYESGKEPERLTFLHNLRYEYPKTQKSSDIVVFGPHEIAAYLATIRKYWDGLNNTVPLAANPFPLPSKAYVDFSEKLDNNIVIYDKTLTSRNKLRNLHLDEKCILLARAIKVKGIWNTVFWDPSRDGPIKDYWK